MIIPTIRYRDAKGAIDFLERAFGLERREVMENEDGTVAHAELTLGRGMVMIGSRNEGDRFQTGRAVLYGIVDDPDAHHDRATAAGAIIVMELTDQPYGSREYAAEDPEGNVWSFGTYDPFATQRSPCQNSSLAMTDRPAQLTDHTGPRGYAYFSYGTWRFSQALGRVRTPHRRIGAFEPSAAPADRSQSVH